MFAEKQIERGKNKNGLPSLIASRWSRRSFPQTKGGIKLFLEPFIFHYHNDLGFAGSFHVYLTALVRCACVRACCCCCCFVSFFFFPSFPRNRVHLCFAAPPLSRLGEPGGWKGACTLALPHATNQSHSSPAVPPVYLFLDSSHSLFILHATS